jgi:GT2 family glycosyltransferase
MAQLDVAVVIVTYKCAALTIESLRSVARERSAVGPQIRAVVVDNDSGDTPAIVAAIEANAWNSWVTLVTAPRNGGFAYGNNLGIAKAFQERVPAYIYLLNPDAQVRSGAIGYLVRFLESHPGVGIAGSSFENADGSEWPIAFKFPSLKSEVLQGMEIGPLIRLFKRWTVAQHMTKTAQPIDWICGASMLVRPTVLQSIGGMDENYFLYFEETDFCFRAKKAGYSTWYVPESRVMHMMGQSTTVTDMTTGPKRFPAYWFESRRRYFAMTYGIGHAIAIDVVSLVACLIGAVKRLLLGRKNSAAPYYIRDLAHHSVIWPRNRNFPARRCGSAPA